MVSESPAAILFNRDGYDVVIADGYTIIPEQSGILMAGKNGSTAKFITLDGSGQAVVVGPGTAGSPSGGVITIQGIGSGTPVTVSGTVTVIQPTASNLHALVVGAAADGYSPMGNPVLVAGWDGTNLHTLRTATDGTVRIDPTGTTTQPVSQVGTWSVSQATSPWITIDTIADGYLQGILANQTNGTQHTIVDGYVQTNPNVNATQSGIWTVQQGTPPWTVNGGYADNTTNTIDKLPVLPAIAKSAPPSWTDGYQVPLTTLLAGQVRTDTTSWLGSTAPTVGQKPMADSIPVVLPSDQTVPVSQTGIISAPNSTTTNLAANATFTGTSVSILGTAGIQFNLKADQPFSIFIEQSNDGTNWDIIDAFYARANVGMSQTVQATAEFFRARLTNTGSATTTFLRFECILFPSVEAVPRTLTNQGNLKISIQDNDHEKQAQFSAFNILKTADEGLIGDLRFNSGTAVSEWNRVITGSGGYTIEPGATGISLNSGADSSSKITFTSKQIFYYQSARSEIVKMSVILGNSGVSNNIREWGLSDGYNGIFLRLNGAILSFVKLNNGIETVIPSTSWDRPVTLDGYGHLWYIQFQWLGAGNYYLYYDEEIVHTIRHAGTSTSLSIGKPDLPVWLRNENTSNTSNVSLKIGCIAVISEGANIMSGIGPDGKVINAKVDADGNFFVITSSVESGALRGLVTGFLLLGGGSAGLAYPVRATTYNEQSTNSQRSMSSANANDTSAGTGASEVKITYYDQDGYGPYIETITMNGTTPVNTTNTNICFIENMYVSLVGSNTTNVGVITLYAASGGGGGAIGTIGTGSLSTGGDGRTLWAHHYIPPGKTASLATVILSNFGGTGSGITTMILKAQKIGIANAAYILISDLIAVPTGSALVRQLGIPILVTGPAKILGYTIPASNNTSSELSFDFSEI